MNYHQMLPVFDVWVLWVLVLLTPLAGLWAMTAFIALHRERKALPPVKHVKSLLKASLSGLTVLLMIGSMVVSGLMIEANKAAATDNIKAKYNISAVTWETPKGIEVSPTDSTQSWVIMVTDKSNNVMPFRYSSDPHTAEPTLEAITANTDDTHPAISPENLLKK